MRAALAMRGFLHWRGTAQRFDPITAGSLYPLIRAALAGLLVYALIRTAGASDLIHDPLFAAAALLFVAVSALVVLIGTDPVRSPIGFRGFVVAVAAIVLASVSSSLSSWGASNVIWDDWGPLAVGLILLCCAEFRPGRDLAAATVGAAAVVGATSALETNSMPLLASPLTSALISATPVLLFGIASSVFSYRMSLSLSRSIEEVAREQGRLSRRVRVRLRELIRDLGRDALSVELVPFLEGVKERGEVTEADVREARRISAVLRSVLITDMALPWLDRLQRTHPSVLVVHDPERLSERLPQEQKVALRALLTALVSAAERDPDDVGSEPEAAVQVRLTRAGRHHSILVRASFAEGEARLRHRFGTFITVMNAVFQRSSVTYSAGELRMLYAFDGPDPAVRDALP
ncbi:hypothetical protein N1028_06160 [Herbiconiux sp. CPCC 203407]|uniref:Uncharacterized protein n=1 Tax=Herbiconiux oxytropis TaxID=2970915 RepID=A0AA41XC25_9MICO|nr:hypothetical protein [Herbiconiux oxytropis]MCS5723705.1 hypothetical protein [Herbiconiux oxytropis]MCS5725476.1 hypothetical protein [Herbiconiux oxytropis]